jgi:hypothetical protein
MAPQAGDMSTEGRRSGEIKKFKIGSVFLSCSPTASRGVLQGVEEIRNEESLIAGTGNHRNT